MLELNQLAKTEGYALLKVIRKGERIITPTELLAEIEKVVNFSARDWSITQLLNEVYSLANGGWLNRKFEPTTKTGRKLFAGRATNTQQRLLSLTAVLGNTKGKRLDRELTLIRQLAEEALITTTIRALNPDDMGVAVTLVGPARKQLRSLRKAHGKTQSSLAELVSLASQEIPALSRLYSYVRLDVRARDRTEIRQVEIIETIHLAE